MPSLVAVLLCAFLAPSAVAFQVFSVEMADGGVLTGSLGALDAEGRMRLDVTDGRPQELAPGQARLLTAVREATRGRGPDVLLLAPRASGGPSDRLVGRLSDGDEFGLTVDLDGEVSVGLAYEAVDRLLPGADRPLDLLAGLEGAGFDDRIWRRRDDGGMDGVSGVLAQASPGGLRLESAMGELDFPLGDVLAVVLAAPEPLVDALPGWPCRVALSGGSAFAAGLMGLSPDGVALATGFADELIVPLDAIDTLLLGPDRSTPPRLLSAGDPVQVEEWTAFGPDEEVLFPWRRDLGVAGRPLRLAGVHATSGLGVHAHSRLVFEVPPGATGLRVAVGLTDDVSELPASGSAGITVLHGERGALATFRAAEGGTPRVLRLADLKPGDRITLQVDAGGDDEAGDRVAWADGVWLP